MSKTTDDPTNQVPAEARPSQAISRRDVFRVGGVSAGLVALGALDPARAVAAELGDRGLVIKMDGLRDAADHLFADLERDPETRRAFVADPTSLIVDRFFQGQARNFTDQHVSDGNCFLFSALANDEFRTWLKEYQAGIAKEIEQGTLPQELDREKTLRDVAEALARFGDQTLLASIIRATSNPTDIRARAMQPDLAPVANVFLLAEIAIAYIAVAVIHIIITAVDATPVAERIESQGVRPFSSSDLRSLSEQMIKRAKYLASSGQLANLSAGT